MKGISLRVSIIVHSTEDVQRILRAVAGLLHIDADEITGKRLEGHFGNPIMLLEGGLTGDAALKRLEDILSGLGGAKRRDLAERITDHVRDSTMYLRLDKQELLDGRMALREEDAVRIEVSVPAYRRGDALESFCRILGAEGK